MGVGSRPALGNVVDDWLAKYDNPQKPLVEAVRRTVLAADKRMDETIKWQASTFTYKATLRVSIRSPGRM